MTTLHPWTRFVFPFQTALDAAGVTLPGALLYFYASGTATPLDTYSDADRTIPNTNPVVADQSGIFSDIFLQDVEYKVVLKNSSDVEIWTADPVAPSSADTSGGAAATVSITAIIHTVDGGGVVPSPGVTGDTYVPFDVELTAVVIMAVGTGDVVLDIWARPFGGTPTIANSIVASSPPTMTASSQSYDSALLGWNTAITAGSQVRYSLTSISGITKYTVALVGTIV